MIRDKGDIFLAFDFGSRFIGVAAGSSSGRLPTPLSAVRVFQSGPDWAGIEALVEEWNPAGFVVGLALNAEGEHTVWSRKAEKFGRRLRRRYNRPVHWINETLTTEAARQALHLSETTGKPRKETIDNTAAALILESFFNT
ncbi:MAG: putative pre-16S rRNA nuclease [Gammaproteobacteria bacterium]|nr:putative pre-16S rRNA nuclease [Gammaproteobacteria bacterium]